MCFQMLYHVDYVENPDATTKIEVGRGLGPRPGAQELLNMVRTPAKIWLANQVVKKAVEIAKAGGRTQEVATPFDIPNMLENSIVFADMRISRYLLAFDGEPWHKELMWESPHLALDNKYIMLQLKDFSYAATVSINKVVDDPEPMGDNILIRRECRIKFGLDAEQTMIYTLPDDWTEKAMEKILATQRG